MPVATHTQHPVNTASVPHRSPFRYPGGKTWLVPTARRWFATLGRPELLIESFAGGGSIGLASIFEDYAAQLLLVEKDPAVAAVWHTILSDDAPWLCRAIRDFTPTEATVAHALDNTPGSTRQLAFQTILRNRVQHGGILAPGAGRMRAGERGKGLTSRWYPQTLATRIAAIHEHRHRITISEDDAIATLSRYQSTPNVAFFIDPPYTAGGKNAGRRLYTHNIIDHDALLAASSALTGPALLTYDNNPHTQTLADRHGFAAQPVAMRNTHNAPMTELLIAKDLSWLHARPGEPGAPTC